MDPKVPQDHRALTAYPAFKVLPVHKVFLVMWETLDPQENEVMVVRKDREGVKVPLDTLAPTEVLDKLGPLACRDHLDLTDDEVRRVNQVPEDQPALPEPLDLAVL